MASRPPPQKSSPQAWLVALLALPVGLAYAVTVETWMLLGLLWEWLRYGREDRPPDLPRPD